MTPSPLRASCCFRLQAPLRFPIEGRVGDILAVMPPSVPDNLWILEPVDLWVVRRQAFPEGKLWSVLADRLEDGTLTLVHAPGRRLLVHLVASGQLSPGQAVRVLKAG